jgi:regulatory protein spx
MIIIYTTPSCSSCRKAKKWLEKYYIKFEEKNLNNYSLVEEDIIEMVSVAKNKFQDIISTRSKIFKEGNLDLESSSEDELIKKIISSPTILKRPIIIEVDEFKNTGIKFLRHPRNARKIQIGYNDDDIRIFIPNWLRQAIMYPEDVDLKKLPINITKKDLEDLR